VVPIEPTREMGDAAVDATDFRWTAPNATGWRGTPQQLFEKAYKAMIKAAEGE